MSHYPTIAYICLEFGINDTIKTYAGGLGILAGDTIKTAADMNLPFVGLSLLYKQGYFKQIVNDNGSQEAVADAWDWNSLLTKVYDKIDITVGTQNLKINVWSYQITGQSGSVPLYYIDLDVEGNPDHYRTLTNTLYPQDNEVKRLQQIVVGYASLQVYEKIMGAIPDIIHINESHAAYAILYLLKRLSKEELRSKFVFTTHTPVLAGHEKHKVSDVWPVLGGDVDLLDESLRATGVLSLSEIAIYYSKFTNAVSKMHKTVTSSMFPGTHVEYVTNGVHPETWISADLKVLFDEHIEDWRTDPDHLRQALILPDEQLQNAHLQAKMRLISYLNTLGNTNFDPAVFTIGFARRSAFYKRNDLIFSDHQRLNEIAKKYGSLQLVFSGKAHPNDQIGQGYIKKIVSISKELTDNLNVVYIPDYGMEISKLLVSGVDLWLNNPIVPMEASGTSGMKASMNGVPSLSTIDGWWKEGSYEGLTGWSVGGGCQGEECSITEIQEMYDKLEKTILPIFYDNKAQWASIMKHSIALNGSYFHTKRMMEEYLTKAYLR